jgi:hypothetical protein
MSSESLDGSQGVSRKDYRLFRGSSGLLASVLRSVRIAGFSLCRAKWGCESMATYVRADDDLIEHLNHVMQQYHPRLVDVELRVDFLLALRGESDEYALTAHGYGALATIRKTNLKDRVKGLGDCELVIDGDHYEEWSERELHALLDHELTHIELVVDKKTGNTKRDDHGRPMVSMRLHDRQMGWFDSVAKRWGDASAEVQQMTELASDWEFVQLYLPGFDRANLGSVRLQKDFANVGTESQVGSEDSH